MQTAGRPVVLGPGVDACDHLPDAQGRVEIGAEERERGGVGGVPSAHAGLVDRNPQQIARRRHAQRDAVEIDLRMPDEACRHGYIHRPHPVLEPHGAGRVAIAHEDPVTDRVHGADPRERPQGHVVQGGGDADGVGRIRDVVGLQTVDRRLVLVHSDPHGVPDLDEPVEEVPVQERIDGPLQRGRAACQVVDVHQAAAEDRAEVLGARQDVHDLSIGGDIDRIAEADVGREADGHDGVGLDGANAHVTVVHEDEHPGRTRGDDDLFGRGLQQHHTARGERHGRAGAEGVEQFDRVSASNRDRGGIDNRDRVGFAPGAQADARAALRPGGRRVETPKQHQGGAQQPPDRP